MGKEELYSMQLNSGAENTPDADPMRDGYRKGIWKEVEDTRDRAAFTPPGQGPNPHVLPDHPQPGTRISPRDREQGKKVEFFVLTRESEPGTEVTGDFLTSAAEGNGDGKRAVRISPSAAKGPAASRELTTENQPTGSDPNTSFKRPSHSRHTRRSRYARRRP